ncbi:MAG: hypothetical protein U1E76_22945 [Planctomycetota bacterium]
MQVEKLNDVDFAIRLTLTHEETVLLKTAIERASFIDTPPDMQGRVLNFCAKMLEIIAQV